MLGLLKNYLILLVFLPMLLTSGELSVGKPAPDFTLDIATKDTIMKGGFTLSNRIGEKPIVLAFYPADWSGGCTREMCTFRDNFEELLKLNVELIGISGDYIFTHKEWAKSLNLPFALLSDHKHEIGKLYNVYDEVFGYNKRSVFVIDSIGTLIYMDTAYSSKDLVSFDKLKSILTNNDKK
ncbi:MAG: peroxiredoxin [Ignavibacteriales bacterium]|nr:peroxiredoxin [Ignavibacteriales bacterium]